MSDFLKYRGYLGTVQYSEEDNLLYGKAAGIKDLISYHGKSLESLKKSFETAIDDYLIVCEAEGLEPDKISSDRLEIMMRKSTEEVLKNYVAV